MAMCDSLRQKVSVKISCDRKKFETGTKKLVQNENKTVKSGRERQSIKKIKIFTKMNKFCIKLDIL